MKLLYLAAGWLCGIFIGLQADAPFLPVALLVTAAISGGVLLLLCRLRLWPALLALALLAALLRVGAGEDPNLLFPGLDGQIVTIQGQVTNDPEPTGQRIKLVVAVDYLDLGSGLTPIQANILTYAEAPAALISLRNHPYFQYGDKVTVKGQVQQPKALADFDYPSYLANQGIAGILFAQETEVAAVRGGGNGGWRGKIYQFRRSLSERLEDALPMPHSSVAQAMLLGQRGQLPDELVEDFRSTGTSHLLAISGMHVGAMMLISMAIATGILGRQRVGYLLFPIAVIWAYALISGLPPSVVRAALMGTVFLVAIGLGRPRSVLPALALTAAVMTAINPHVLQQISFQLSFTAMAGIALALPLQGRVSAAVTSMASRFEFWGGPALAFALNWAAAALLVSLAASLATWPLVAFNFDRVPLLGIIVTAVSLPALPFILLGSLATAVMGLAHPVFGQAFGWFAWVPISYLVELVSRAPALTISGAWVGQSLVWAWYLGLGAMVLLVRAAPHLVPREFKFGWLFWQPVPGAAGLARANGANLWLYTGAIFLLTACVFVWPRIFSGPDGNLHVYFFDVGQGDSALIVAPSGKQVLIDGGPATNSATSALAESLPRGDRSLDMVVLTHLDADHSRGLLNVMDRYRVASVVVGFENPDNAMYPSWQAEMEKANVLRIPVRAGHRIVLEPGVIIDVLNPPSRPIGGSVAEQNDNGVVLRLVYGKVSFLLAADIERAAENRLAQVGMELNASVLKVAHHGSKTSSTPGFLQRVNPTAAVVSVGATNRFGHPDPEVMRRLSDALGSGLIYQTDRNGTIEFISDGERLWVETER